MFKIDDRETKQLERELGVLRDRAFPFATKNTLNRAAFVAQKMYKRNIQRKLTTRNRYTEQSIRVEQAKGLQIRQQMSIVGSTAPYMEKQEFGGITRRGGKWGVPLATAYSSGEGLSARPRKKLSRKPNKLRNIVLKRNRRKAKTKRQATLFRVQDAIASGNRIIFLRLGGGSQGIFKVVGGRPGFTKNAKLRMLWDLSESTTPVPKEPLLKPAYDKASGQIPRIYRDSLRFQIERQRLFR